MDPLFHPRDEVKLPGATLHLPGPERKKGTEQQNSRNRHPNSREQRALAAHGGIQGI
jgi:hypothetical protein